MSSGFDLFGVIKRPRKGAIHNVLVTLDDRNIAGKRDQKKALQSDHPLDRRQAFDLELE